MSVLANQTIVGTVGRIYDLRTVGKDNRAVIDFSVAVTPRRKTPEGEWTDGETYWVTITAWGRLAENISKWNKGDRVIVIGRTEMKPGYTDKDGVDRDARPIVVADFAGHEDSIYPSEQKRENSSSNSSAPAKKAPARPAKKAEPDDDLDFDVDDDSDDFELTF